MTLTLVLPLPPSSNHLYPSGKGRRFRSKEYEGWIKEAGWELRFQRPSMFEGKVGLTIEVREPPTAAREDCISREKAVTDLLVTHGILKDDSQHYVREITVKWAADLKNQVRITIKDWEG